MFAERFRDNNLGVPRISIGRSWLLPVVAVVAILAIAIPALGADPSASPGASGHAKEPKPSKGPEIALTLTGTVATTTDAKGRPTFTMTVGGVTWELSAGPKWYWLDKNPLAAYVGKSVKVVGSHHAGENKLRVETVDGKAIRAPGKPPWAGGPKKLGKIHPGFGHGQGHARDGAPGQLKDKSGAKTHVGADTDNDDGTEGPGDSPAPNSSGATS
jgi:hypothetical protein